MDERSAQVDDLPCDAFFVKDAREHASCPFSGKPESGPEDVTCRHCGISGRAIKAAAAAKHATDGAYPATVAELLPAYLSEAPALRGPSPALRPDWHPPPIR